MPVEDISKLYKYSAKEGAHPAINKLNSVEWTKTKLRIKERIKNIEDVLHVGDKVTVKVSDIDDQGRINLTMKDLIEPKVYEED